MMLNCVSQFGVFIDLASLFYIQSTFAGYHRWIRRAVLGLLYSCKQTLSMKPWHARRMSYKSLNSQDGLIKFLCPAVVCVCVMGCGANNSALL